MKTIPYYLLPPEFRPDYVPPPEAHFYNRLRNLTRPATIDKDEDLPVCTVCNHTIPELEIFYTGSDGKDYCQHCYDFDEHGVYTE